MKPFLALLTIFSLATMSRGEVSPSDFNLIRPSPPVITESRDSSQVKGEAPYDREKAQADILQRLEKLKRDMEWMRQPRQAPPISRPVTIPEVVPPPQEVMLPPSIFTPTLPPIIAQPPPPIVQAPPETPVFPQTTPVFQLPPQPVQWSYRYQGPLRRVQAQGYSPGYSSPAYSPMPSCGGGSCGAGG